MKITKAKLERAIKQGQIRAARELAKSIPDLIRERVRAGLGLSGPLKALSDNYVKFRRRVARRLAATTSPNQSNLTATGQMLAGIIGEATGSIIRIFIRGNRKREINGQGGKTNNEIRKYVEKDRPFFELTNAERQVIAKSAAETIKQEIKRALK